MYRKQQPFEEAAELGIFTLIAQGLTLPLATPARYWGADAGPDAPGATPPREGLFRRIERWFWSRRQEALDAHLAQARDVYELEDRLREVGQPARHLPD